MSLLAHRWSGISAALLASVAFIFCIWAVMVCNFVEINAVPGSLILSASGEDLMEVTATFGVFCDDVFYDGSDKMWDLSRIFFYASTTLGAAAVILAWAISTVLPPTYCTWRVISSLSAVTAVLQVPIFIIFESEPCTGALEDQTCSLSGGSYYLIVSTIFWVAVTLCTQCLDPPSWAEQLSFWRIPKIGGHHIVVATDEEEFGNGNGTFPPSTTRFDGVQKSQAERESKKSDLSLPAVSTDSMKDDEFDWNSPRHYDDGMDSRMANQSQSIVSRDDQKSMSRASEESWLAERAKKATPPTPTDTVLYFKPSVQSQAKEQIRIVSPGSPDRAPKSPRSTRSPRSPSRGSQSGSLRSRKSGSLADSGVFSSAEILADLSADFKQYSDRAPLTKADKGAPDKYSLGLRALTGKLTKDAHRRRNRRKHRRGGYEEMFDDGDSDDEPFMSPPIEVKIKPFANFEKADFSQQDFTDDEKEDLMDNWNALHKATTAGVRMGLQEGYRDEGEWIDFDMTVKGYYSDPEPSYYPSDASNSKVSLSELNGSSPARSQTREDTSTISGSSGSAGETTDSKKPRSRSKSRRKRNPGSTNVSVVSGGASLLDVTIDEETDQDVLKEISDDEEEEGILGAYSLQRTLSEPLPRKDGRSTGSRRGKELETISLNPSRMAGRMRGTPNKFSSSNSSAFSAQLIEPDDPVATTSAFLSLPTLDKDRQNLGVIDAPMPQKRPPPSPKAPSTSMVVKRGNIQTRSISLSPRRDRSLKLETWKTDTASLGGMHARRAAMAEDDSSSHSSEGSEHSKASKRARQCRIKRLRRMKELRRQSATDDSYEKDRRRAPAHARVRDVDAGSVHGSDHSVETDIMHGSEHRIRSYRDQRIIVLSDSSTSTESASVSEETNKSYRDKHTFVAKDTNTEYQATSRSYTSMPRSKSYRDHRTTVVSDEFTVRSYPDRRTILSDLLRNVQSQPIDPDGDVPDRTSSPDDLADLGLDYGPSSQYLPKFSVNLEQDFSYSPTSTHGDDGSSPELSPVQPDKTEQADDAPSYHSEIADDLKEFPTLTTENDSTAVSDTADDGSEEVDEFPVDTNIASMTGIKNVTANVEEQLVVEENLDSKYGSFDMDELDLQLIAVRRPMGQEYGDDEVSM